MQPNCRSGEEKGETVQTVSSGGGSPVLHDRKRNEGRKEGETAGCARSGSKGLGLDG